MAANPRPQSRQPSKIPRLLFYLCLLAVLGTVFWQRQNIYDWWHLRNYVPPAAVSKLADETTMTSTGRKIFYVSQPAIQDKQQFYQSCSENEATVVLGCYKPTGEIYLLLVTDERLNGVEQVTAAHEMLHGAYSRLSSRKRQEVDAMLNQAYASNTNQAIIDKVNSYKKSGADISNELHSILATEVANLPKQLEDYYKQYFASRSAVVAFSDKYESEFTARKDKVTQLDGQLASIEQQVTANNKTLDEMQASINTESARLDSLLQANNITEYNKGVAAYNKNLAPFKKMLADTKQLVANYKSILEERNRIASEAQQLTMALDSSIQTTVEEK